MNQGKYIFAQLTDFLPRRVFDTIVAKYDGNKKIRTFTCWNQMLCMIFGQLTARDSMRDLMLSLEAHNKKYYHLGLGKSVTRTNLGKANRNRDYRIYEEFAYVLIEEARSSVYKDDFEVKVDGNVYAFDSSTIDLCLSVFWWAEFRKHKGGIKLHTLYDVKTSIPSLVLITSAKVHDVNMLDALTYAGNPANIAGLEGVELIEGDICDTALVEKLLSERGIQTIVHFAAESHVDRSITGPDAFVTTNVIGTHSLLKAAR